MNDTDGTLEEWRDIAQKLAEQAKLATVEIKKLIEELKKTMEQRDKLYKICRDQHEILVEHGIIDDEEVLQ